MSSGEFHETSPPIVRHLLVCQHIVWNENAPGAHYMLRGIVTQYFVSPGTTFPVRIGEAWVYYQAQGDPGEYDLWLELVLLGEGDEGEDESVAHWPLTLVIAEGVWVASRAVQLANVPFVGFGEYEMRLTCGPDVLARTSFYLSEG